MFNDSLKVHSNTSNFKISIGDFLENYEDTEKRSRENVAGNRSSSDLGLSYYYEFSPTSTNISGTNVLSYSFSNSVNTIESNFTITIKEDTKPNNEYFLDKVKELDVVKIEENGKVVFIGVIRTVSFGATAGAYNKVITLSGMSASALLKMFKIYTDLSVVQSFVADTSNADLTSRISNLFIENKKKKNYEGVDVTEIFRLVYLNFYYISNGYKKKGKTWKKGNNKVISNTKIQRLFNYIFGVCHEDNKDGSYVLNTEAGHTKPVEFLTCNLKMKYQICRNLYNESECSVYSYFAEMFPAELYEFYCDFETRQFILREKPFTAEMWKNIPISYIDPSTITDYTLTKTDMNVYTAFFSYPEGSTIDRSTFKIINSSDDKGNSVVQISEELVGLYGFIPFDCSIVGYVPTQNDKKTFSAIDISKDYSQKLANAYQNLRDMYCGDVTFINLNNGMDKPKVGQKILLCNNEFYVTDESHSWSFGNCCKINLKLERGGKYLNGEFQKSNSQISKTWAELLEKE